ncbi:hypothetical protein DRQ18_08060, partial [bacterium]
MILEVLEFLLVVSQVPNHNAVVVSGKVATQDYNEFWNDCFLMWELFYRNGWSNDHVHVIYGDGTGDYESGYWRYQAGQYELDSITDRPSFREELWDLLDDLAVGDPAEGISPMGPQDNFFFWVLAHGRKENAVRVVDASDPSNPVALQPAYFLTSNNAVFCAEVSYPYLFVGAGKEVGPVKESPLVYALTSVVAPNLFIFDISDPFTPLKVGSLNVSHCEDIAVNGNYAYLTLGFSGQGVMKVNISDPSQPQSEGVCYT